MLQTLFWSKMNVLVAVFVLQKRALRLISVKGRLEHSNPLFYDLKILKLLDINSFVVSNFMFKVYRRVVPIYFQKMFTLNSSIHLHFTRQSSDLHIPIIHTNRSEMTIRYSGVIIWNKMSRTLNWNCSIETFKNNLRKSIIAGYQC